MAATRRRARAFTLIEVLAATALFALLGTLLFSVVRGAMDLWATGERNRELNDRATAALDVVAEDLRCAWPGLPGAAEQDSRFLVVPHVEERLGAGESLGNAAGSGPGASPGIASNPAAAARAAQSACSFTLLAFARLCHEEHALDWLRRAGDTAGAEGTASLAAPQDPTGLQPTGGLAEALFLLAVPPGESLPSLVRRVRMPLGGTGSLLDEDAWTDAEGRLRDGLPADGSRDAAAHFASRDAAPADGVRLADRVLWFGVLCWGPQTTCWERSPGDPADAVPALQAWDSTRGLPLSGAESFPYEVGPASLRDGTDDIFPRRVRVTLVLERDEGNVTTGALADDLSPTSTELTIGSTRFLQDEQKPDSVLVDAEWLGVTAIDGHRLTVVRGARGTRPATHVSGSAVRAGRRFDRVIELPCARENWNR